MLWGNSANRVKFSGEDLWRYSNRMERVGLRKCPCYYITMTGFSQSLSGIMAGKLLHHCHPMYYANSKTSSSYDHRFYVVELRPVSSASALSYLYIIRTKSVRAQRAGLDGCLQLAALQTSHRRRESTRATIAQSACVARIYSNSNVRDEPAVISTDVAVVCRIGAILYNAGIISGALPNFRGGGRTP